MSKSSLVERSRLAAQRSAGAVSVETSRAWYQENLERELGRPEGGWGEREVAPEDGLMTILTRPITLVLLTILLIIAILGIMLWRDGVIDDFLDRNKPKGKSTQSQLGAGQTAAKRTAR
jgi:hypothetical protein